jgi:hypothetical protein
MRGVCPHAKPAGWRSAVPVELASDFAVRHVLVASFRAVRRLQGRRDGLDVRINSPA